MSLSRPQSRASSGGRGPPPTPPPTYLWEEVRRQRSRGGYPWTILDKEPLENSVDVELLLKGEISGAAGNSSLPEEYSTESLQRKRFSRRDRYNQGRARSEPTPSIPSSDSISNMASAAPEEEEVDVDEFPLTDEDIPDFVMEYLQSDAGNLEDNIPDHILEYIQSRAAALQRKPEPEDEIVYTEDELRIIEDTRRKMEERGELPKLTVEEPQPEEEPKQEDDDFDVFFQQALDNAGVVSAAVEEPVEATPPPAAEETGTKPKKGGKFKFRSISMPPKPQINLRLPKALKRSKETTNEERKEKIDKKKEKKEKRIQSVSPIRQRINEQFQSWNNSLKKLKPLGKKNKNKEDDVKGFIALLPGVSSGKSKELEHQYEEVQAPPKKEEYFQDDELDLRERFPETVAVPEHPAPVVTITAPDDLVLEDLDVRQSEESIEKVVEVTNPEETMEDVENLPESEIADLEPNGFVPDDEEILEQQFNEEDGVLEQQFRDEDEALEQQFNEEDGVLEQQFRDEDEALEQQFRDEDEALEQQFNEEDGVLEQQFRDEDGVLEQQFNEEDGVLEHQFRDEVGVLEQQFKDEELGKLELDEEHFLESSETREDPVAPAEVPEQRSKASVLAARGLKALEATKSTIQRKLSRENLQATRNKLQATFSGTLKKRGKNKKGKSSTLPRQSPQENIFEFFTTPRSKNKDYETSTPKEMAAPRRNRNKQKEMNNEYPTATRRKNKKIRQSNALSSLVFDDNFTLEKNTEKTSEVPVDVQPEPVATEEGSDKENHVVVPNPRRRSKNRVSEKRYGFHEDFIRPQSAYYASEARNSWNDFQRFSQDIQDAFCAPINSLEAVDGSTGEISRRPQRPSRSRRKNRFSTLSEVEPDYHDYCNVPNPNPRRLKKSKKNVQDPYTTWPRKHDLPAVPKRSRKPKMIEVENFGTWPRKCEVPTAPRRSRSKTGTSFLNASEPFNDFNVMENRYDVPNSQPVYNITPTEVPETVLKFEETEEEALGVENKEDIAFADESNAEDVVPENIAEDVVPAEEENEEIVVPKAPMRKIKGRTGSFRHEKKPGTTFDGTTWPRVKKEEQIPMPPGRNHRKSQFLEQQPLNGVTAPSATPTEFEPKISNDEALQELDQLLETLATTQQQSAPAAELKTEDPYSEIKPARKSPPPRPPPPIYSPQSTTSYSYIYTVPRRNPRTYHEISPERSLRDYCTIRPHRPPRRSRPRTEVYEESAQQQVNENGRRHSISHGEDVNVQRSKTASDQSDGDTNTEEQRERKLQDSSVIEKMRGRPLPAPPRAKRIRSHSPPQKPPRREPSLRRKGSLRRSSEQCQQKSAMPKTINIDGYEPISPEPLKVEEVSIAIQTDPLPEYEDFLGSTLAETAQEQSAAESFEINNNYQPSIEVPEALDVEHAEQSVPVSSDICLDAENTEQSVPVSSDMCLDAENTDRRVPGSSDIKEINIETELESQCDVPDVPQNTTEVQKPTNLEEKFPKPKESTEDSNVRRSSRALDDEDSYSRIPPNFPLAFPRLNVDFPSRLQLVELDVDRLNVRDLHAHRLVVSNIDTQSLQVSEITSLSGPLVLSTTSERVPVATVESSVSQSVVSEALGESLVSQPVVSEPLVESLVSQPVVSEPLAEPWVSQPVVSEPLVESSVSQPVPEEKKEEKQVERKPVETSDFSLQCEFPQHVTMTTQTDPDPKTQEEPLPKTGTESATPVGTETAGPIVTGSAGPVGTGSATPVGTGSVGPVVTGSAGPVGTGSAGPVVTESAKPVGTEPVEPTVGELTLQLVGVSARQLGRAAGVMAQYTWQVAQRVARLGWQRIDEQLRARGVHLSKQEEQNVQVIVILIMIIIAGILLLGMGRRGMGHRWELYYPY